ncbi:hypothetical protein BKA82DRAFT_1008747, partial [Pisolithus tinctorius]
DLTEPKYSTEAIHPSHHNTHEQRAQIFRRIGCTTIYMLRTRSIFYTGSPRQRSYQLLLGQGIEHRCIPKTWWFGSGSAFLRHVYELRSLPCHGPQNLVAKGTREVVLLFLPGLLPLSDRYPLLFRAHDAVPHQSGSVARRKVATRTIYARANFLSWLVVFTSPD